MLESVDSSPTVDQALVRSTLTSVNVCLRLCANPDELPFRYCHITQHNNTQKDFVLTAIQQLVKFFLINGYAWEGSASISKATSGIDAGGAQFTISLTSPANLWSGQALELRNKATPGGGIMNSFLLTTAKELVSRMGYEVTSSSISYDGTKETSSFTLR